MPTTIEITLAILVAVLFVVIYFLVKANTSLRKSLRHEQAMLSIMPQYNVKDMIVGIAHNNFFNVDIGAHVKESLRLSFRLCRNYEETVSFLESFLSALYHIEDTKFSSVRYEILHHFGSAFYEWYDAHGGARNNTVRFWLQEHFSLILKNENFDAKVAKRKAENNRDVLQAILESMQELNITYGTGQLQILIKDWENLIGDEK